MTEKPSNRPDSLEEYESWLKSAFDLELTSAVRARYESIAKNIRASFEDSPFWLSVISAMPQLEDQYERSTGYRLLAEQPSRFDEKSFGSFLLKSFRRNSLDNKNWPAPPGEGWIIPDAWFEQIKDIVRTLFVVKYLDGVEFLAEQIAVLAKEHQLETSTQFEAKPEGYYAAHLCVRYPIAIPGLNWDAELRHIWIELQITTQLQEVIRTLLHAHYEERRVTRNINPDRQWQWDFRGDEFATNYLGHILHYIEGMIMEVRDKQREQE